MRKLDFNEYKILKDEFKILIRSVLTSEILSEINIVGFSSVIMLF